MTHAVETFFETWGMTDPEERLRTLQSILSPDIAYAGPNTPEALVGVGDISAHVGTYVAHMPGGSAKAVKVDAHHGVVRATVDFLKDGEAMMRGQYFADIDSDGNITRMIGFTGTGEDS